jgi:uncharacterized cupin superfamily protein
MTAPYSRADGWFLPARQYHRRRMLCHWDEVPERPVEQRPMNAGWTDLGAAAGSVDVGLRRIRIAPGAQSTPAHAHDLEEELCYVLAGAGLSWQDGTTYEVRAGDALVHLARGPAHTLVAGGGGLDVLMFGQRRWAELGRLPRTGAAWLGASWVEVGAGEHPWAREVAAGPVPVDGEPAPRPPGIVAMADVPAPELRHGELVCVRRDVGTALGSSHTGMRHVIVEPGKRGQPQHCHSAEEELFVVLEGDGVLLLGDDEHPVRAGHVVSRPAGSGVAHAFRAGPGGMTYLAYGERKPDDAIWYPRSQKIFMRGLGVVFRVQTVDFWDGEE